MIPFDGAIRRCNGCIYLSFDCDDMSCAKGQRKHMVQELGTNNFFCLGECEHRRTEPEKIEYPIIRKIKGFFQLSSPITKNRPYKSKWLSRRT